MLKWTNFYFNAKINKLDNISTWDGDERKKREFISKVLTNCDNLNINLC